MQQRLLERQELMVFFETNIASAQAWIMQGIMPLECLHVGDSVSECRGRRRSWTGRETLLQVLS